MDCEWMNNFECWLQNTDFAQWLSWISQNLWKVWDKVAFSISDSFSSVWNSFMSTSAWKFIWFIWDLVLFLLYWVRSIILLVWNLFYSILNWFVELFTQLLSTFTDLSWFMGSSTSILVSLFVLVLLILWFQFLFRFFSWKYHYKKVSK